MFLPKLTGKENTKRERIQTFLGLNRRGDIADNEFSDMLNLSCDAYPALTTRKGRTAAFTGGLDVAVGDNEYLDSYNAPTGIKKSADGTKTGFYYRGNKLFELEGAGYRQIVKLNNDFILLPDPYFVSAVVSGDGQVFSSEKENFAYRLIGDSYDDSASNNYTDIWFDMGNVNGNAVIGINTGRIIGELKTKINEGSLKAGDRLRLQFVKGSKTSRTPLSGYDNTVLYVIKSIVMDPNGGDHTGDYFYITCECYNAQGLRIAPAEITINGVDLRDNLKHVIISGVIDGTLGEAYQGRIFVCDRIGSALYYSAKQDFKDWGGAGDAAGGGRVEVAQGGLWTGIKSFNGYLYVFKRDGLYRVMGSNATNYQAHWVNGIGCVNQESVCEYNSMLYYLNWDGIYAFDGNDSVKISGKLDRKYKSGVLGAYGGKLYCCLEGFSAAEGGNEFLVYDIGKKLWHKEEYLDVNSFVRYTDGLYAVTDSACWMLSGEAEPVQFSVTTKKFYYAFGEKAVNEVCLYTRLGERTSVAVEISYDGGVFEPCGVFSGAGAMRIPVKLKKCGEFQIRLSGTGTCTILDLEFGVYYGKSR